MAAVRMSWLSWVLAALLPPGAMPAVSAERSIYPPPARAQDDLTQALAVAAAGHKRILLDFGGNWCTDCIVLDRFFHDAANAPLLEADFILVHINIGRMNENMDMAGRYRIPLRKGVPALAILGEHGDLIYSQQGGGSKRCAACNRRRRQIFFYIGKCRIERAARHARAH